MGRVGNGADAGTDDAASARRWVRGGVGALASMVVLAFIAAPAGAQCRNVYKSELNGGPPGGGLVLVCDAVSQGQKRSLKQQKRAERRAKRAERRAKQRQRRRLARKMRRQARTYPAGLPVQLEYKPHTGVAALRFHCFGKRACRGRLEMRTGHVPWDEMTPMGSRSYRIKRGVPWSSRQKTVRLSVSAEGREALATDPDPYPGHNISVLLRHPRWGLCGPSGCENGPG